MSNMTTNVTPASPADSLSDTLQRMVERFQAQVEEFRGDFTLQLGADQIVDACQALHDTESFEMLIDITAVDFWPAEVPRFHLVYQLRSITRNLILGLQVPLNGHEPVSPSVTQVYPNADWYERELWDLFGIHFAGHPDLRRILMPHDWAGHPLRKDYPLGYEEPQFTFNYEKIQARKLNPKE